MNDNYENFIKQEIIKGISHTLTSAIMTLIKTNDLTTEDAVAVLRDSTDRVVAFLAQQDGKKVGPQS